MKLIPNIIPCKPAVGHHVGAEHAAGRDTNRPCMIISLPNAGSSSKFEGTSAGMPNFAAVRCWRTSTFRTWSRCTDDLIPCFHYGISDGFRVKNALQYALGSLLVAARGLHVKRPDPQ